MVKGEWRIAAHHWPLATHRSAAMPPRARVTVLGCGGSGGVPLIGGNWGRCNPANPRNRRRRVSILVEAHGHNILVDTSPDLRAQLLDAAVARIDAVLYTHDHADHSHGIDDLRFLSRESDRPPIPAYGTERTLRILEERFGYIFRQATEGSSALYRPFLKPRRIDGPFEIGPVPVIPFAQDHGYGSTTTGYRIGDVAYSTDVVNMSETAFAVLEGLDLWIVDCLSFEPHPTHAHFERAIEWIERVRPRRAVLTHLNHTIDYDELAARCPPGVEPAYDGMVIEVG
jgi:phosphoribosyl 1,2-cyclic phosphate phosphodiesterase